MMSLAPNSNTIAAACGSAKMLNSAAGVTLPSPMAPPISTIWSMWATMSGARWIALAMLVSGPIGQSVTAPGCARRISMITSTA